MAGSIENDFLEAYEQYSEALFRHCYFRVYERERAHELVQDTFMKTWEYVAAGNEIRNFRAFLYRVAQNLIVDEARRRKIRRETSLDEMKAEFGFEPSIDDRDVLERRIEGADAMKLLTKLSDEDRDVLILRFVDELEPREIADVLDVSANAVSVRIHRAMKRLRELLDHA